MPSFFLPTGQECLYDAADALAVVPFPWHFCNGYARRDNPNGRGKGFGKLYMHRAIMGVQKGLEVDHANGNGLDNRRCNLRICTRSQNQANTPAYSSNKAGIKGVFWNERRGEWVAQICRDGKSMALGYFKTSAEACAAYRTAAKLLHGEYAYGSCA